MEVKEDQNNKTNYVNYLKVSMEMKLLVKKVLALK